MRCSFCFATFTDIGNDILPKGHLNREDCLSVVETLAAAGFDKINFAGGEPDPLPLAAGPDPARQESGMHHINGHQR